MAVVEVYVPQKSKAVKEIMNAVESYSNWSDVKRYRKNIDEIAIGMEKETDQNGEEFIRFVIHYNLRKK